MGRDDGRPIDYQSNTAELALYDLKSDIGETTDVSPQYPDQLARLHQAAESYRLELGDRLNNRTGSGIRPAGQAIRD